MSNQVNKKRRLLLFIFIVLLMVAGFLPPAVQGEDVGSDHRSPLSLVEIQKGETPATLAHRYFGNATKEWMIREYNDVVTLPGKAIIIPHEPFRLGGLALDGFQTVPVLVFPDFSNLHETEKRTFLSAFSKQMHWLRTNGFTSITPMQLFDFLSFSDQIPQRSVLITADTEARTFFDQAMPILQEHGFTATVFVAADLVGDKMAMGWNQLRQLQKMGYTIGCRGRSGKPLTRQKKGQTFQTNFQWMKSDLRYAKEKIEAKTGTACQFLAYPDGSTNPLVSAMAAKLGFSAAFSRSKGDNPFYVDRFAIHRTVIDSKIHFDRIVEQLSTFIAADLNG